MDKRQIPENWNEWLTYITWFLGPLTSLIFEEKYTGKQIFARLIIGAACSIYLGGYLSDHIDNRNLQLFSVYMSGVGGYYIIKGLVKILELFGIDPKSGVRYFFNIVGAIKKGATESNTNNENNNQNSGSNSDTQ